MTEAEVKLKARVISVSDQSAEIEILPEEECSACPACGICRQKKRTLKLSASNLKNSLEKDQTITVGCHQDPALKLTTVTYGIPLAAFMLSILLFSLIFTEELLIFLGSITITIITGIICGKISIKLASAARLEVIE